MTDTEPDRSLEELGDDLSRRLKQARSKELGAKRKEPKLKTEVSGLGQAFRIGVDMVSALIVGVGLGWWFDSVFGTKPWFLIFFIILGGVAGIFNAYRTAMRMAEDLIESKPSDATIEKDSANDGEFAQKK